MREMGCVERKLYRHGAVWRRLLSQDNIGTQLFKYAAVLYEFEKLTVKLLTQSGWKYSSYREHFTRSFIVNFSLQVDIHRRNIIPPFIIRPLYFLFSSARVLIIAHTAQCSSTV